MSFIDRLRDRLFGFSDKAVPQGPMPGAPEAPAATDRIASDHDAPEIDFSQIRRALFVCSGNMCRSPYGEARFRRLTEGRDIRVMSAGTLGIIGRMAAPEMIATARERGLDLEAHRSSALTSMIVRASDAVFVMEEYHRREVLRLCPESGPRIVMLGLWQTEPAPEIVDPMGRAPSVYREAARRIDDALARWCAQNLGIATAPQ